MNGSVSLFVHATPEHATETNTAPTQQGRLFVFLRDLSHAHGFTECVAWAEEYA